MLDNIRADFRRFSDRLGLVHAVFDPALWAVATFRFGKSVQGIRRGIVRKPLSACYFFLYKAVEIVSGIRISVDSEIGPGLLIRGCGGILIHGQIGRGCTIAAGAQLVSRGDLKGRGWPSVGDDVSIGPGAKILGPINVGDRVRIKPNAVVRADVPEESAVMPPECRVVEPAGDMLPDGA